MRIIGYVIRGVRLLAAPWRASSQSIWHLNVYHKGSVALFNVFEHFFGCFLSLLVPLVYIIISPFDHFVSCIRNTTLYPFMSSTCDLSFHCIIEAALRIKKEGGGAGKIFKRSGSALQYQSYADA